MKSGNSFFKTGILFVLVFAICASQADAELKINSVYPTMGIKGKDLPITIRGSGFDANTRVSMTIDAGNRNKIISSVDVPFSANNIIVSDSIAYLLEDTGLYMIDISNPLNPKTIGKHLIQPYNFAVSDSIIYLTLGDYGIAIVKEQDYLLSNIDTPGFASAIAVSGSLAYVADGDAGLQIIDISNLEYPKIIGNIKTPGFAGTIAVSGSLAYVTDSEAGLQVIDVDIPESPRIIGSVDTPGGAQKIAVSGSLACIAKGSSGLQVIDISIPNNPKTIWNLNTSNTFSDVTISDTKIYATMGFAWNGNLLIIDMSTPVKPKTIGNIVLPHSANAVAVSGKTAYVADGIKGLQIIDVNYASAIPIAVDTPYFNMAVAAYDSIAYVSNQSSVLQIIDMKNLPNTKIIGTIEMPSCIDDIAVSGSKVYVGSGKAFYILDVSNPSSPNIIGSLYGSEPSLGCGSLHASRIVTYDSIVYYGFTGIDVSDPSNPKIVSSLPCGYKALTVSGQKVYGIGARDCDLTLTNMNDSSNPKIIANIYDGFSKVTEFSIFNSIAYVGIIDDESNYSWFYEIDISDSFNPLNPKINYRELSRHTYDIASSDSMLYVASGVGLALSGGYVPYVGVEAMDINTNTLIGRIGIEAHKIEVRKNALAIPSSKTRTISATNGGGEDVLFIAGGYNGLLILPTPIEVKPMVINSSTLSVTIPGIQATGNYTIRVFNNTGEASELPGAVTIVPPEESYLLDTKAIIVVGTKSDDNVIQNTTQAGAQAYRSLLYQGYTAESIYYLAPDTSAEGVDAKATYADLSYAINTWAKQSPAASELLIYFIDHGGSESFHISADEILSSGELGLWLDELQNDNIPVTLIYDACKSGSFLSDISPPPDGRERIVITSTLPSEEAIMSKDLSFSYFFWDGIYLGYGIGEAFDYARNQIPPQQTPQLDADGNGIGNEPEDEAIITGRKIRRGYRPQMDIPYIYDVSLPQILHNETSAKFKAGVSYIQDGTAVRRVWAVIMPPNFQPDSPDMPITDFPTIELTDTDNDGIYEGVYDNFTKNGIYNITICAMNIQGIYALFRQTTVTKASNYITGVSPAKTLSGYGSSALLWASVQTGIGIQQVRAEITPPDGIGTVSITLEDSEQDGVYQASYDNFIKDGTYVVKVYATDTEGYTTPFTQTTVTRTSLAEADSYEPDNSYDKAKFVSVNTVSSSHNFHEPTDADWMKFRAFSGKTYTIRTKNHGQACDTGIGIYSVSGGVPVLLAGPINKQGTGQEEFYDWTCPKDGYYFVKTSNAAPDNFGKDVSYDLEIDTPIAGITGTIQGTITDSYSGKPIAEAEVMTSGEGFDLSMENGAFALIKHSVGDYTLTVNAAGYQPYETSVTVSENEPLIVNIVLKPITPVFAVTFSAGTGGSVSGSTSQMINQGGKCLPVKAKPNAGYQFANWSGAGGFVTTTANPLTIMNVTADMTVTANFQPITHTLTFQSSSNGSISGTTSQIVNHGGSSSAVTALPNAGYQFVNWTGTDGFISTANPLTVTNITADMNITADFQAITLNVAFTSGIGGSVSGTASQMVNYNGNCSPITAVPDTGYRFVNWTGTGGFIAADNPLTVMNVVADMTVTAHFGIPGNVDGDNNIGLDDVILILQIMSGISVQGEVNLNADVNGDNRIGMEEVIYILQKTAELR